MMHYVQAKEDQEFFLKNKKAAEIQADTFSAYYVASQLFKLSVDDWLHISRTLFKYSHPNYPSTYGRLIAIASGMHPHILRKGRDKNISECDRNKLFMDVKSKAISILDIDDSPSVSFAVNWVTISREVPDLHPLVFLSPKSSKAN